MIHADCHDFGEGACEGNVEVRSLLNGSGRAHPRCTRHWGLRLAEQLGADRTLRCPPPGIDQEALAEDFARWREEEK